MDILEGFSAYQAWSVYHPRGWDTLLSLTQRRDSTVIKTYRENQKLYTQWIELAKVLLKCVLAL